VPARRWKGKPEKRGNNVDRARRRAWLWDRFSSPSGKTILCFHCGKRIRSKECRPNKRGRLLSGFVVDRSPLCGHDGGTYRRDNIVPSCVRCNAKRGQLCSTGRCPQRGRKVSA
jgi:hypothetical protein